LGSFGRIDRCRPFSASGKGRLAGRRLVQYGAQREDIGARVGLFAFELLPRHVLKGADDFPFDRNAAVRCRQARHRHPLRRLGRVFIRSPVIFRSSVL